MSSKYYSLFYITFIILIVTKYTFFEFYEKLDLNYKDIFLKYLKLLFMKL